MATLKQTIEKAGITPQQILKAFEVYLSSDYDDLLGTLTKRDIKPIIDKSKAKEPSDLYELNFINNVFRGGVDFAMKKADGEFCIPTKNSQILQFVLDSHNRFGGQNSDYSFSIEKFKGDWYKNFVEGNFIFIGKNDVEAYQHFNCNTGFCIDILYSDMVVLRNFHAIMGKDRSDQDIENIIEERIGSLISMMFQTFFKNSKKSWV